VGVWGSFIQGSNSQNLEILNIMGSELSKRIGCPVHYPAWDKPVFECKHLIKFPKSTINRALETDDWQWIIDYHKNEIVERGLS